VKNSEEILREVAGYYSAKLAEFGESPQGVDWNSQESQNLRFDQLMKIVQTNEGFSINDLGCGYGALIDFLQVSFKNFSYQGIDVSEEMLTAAKLRYVNFSQSTFVVGAKPSVMADYGIASGIFNVRLGRTDDEWQHFLCETLDILSETSRQGFAFNCLTSYSDREKMRDYLYYANPLDLFDLCKKKYSRHVSLLHDYGLYEFTILVRKVL
jgi:SAM-dependent methyltransferase